jgi:hypothetical protein
MGYSTFEFYWLPQTGVSCALRQVESSDVGIGGGSSILLLLIQDPLLFVKTQIDPLKQTFGVTESAAALLTSPYLCVAQSSG